LTLEPLEQSPTLVERQARPAAGVVQLACPTSPKCSKKIPAATYRGASPDTRASPARRRGAKVLSSVSTMRLSIL
jgi:hypothetical protein